MANRKTKSSVKKTEIILDEKQTSGDDIVQSVINNNPEVRKHYTKKYKMAKNPTTGEMMISDEEDIKPAPSDMRFTMELTPVQEQTPVEKPVVEEKNVEEKVEEAKLVVENKVEHHSTKKEKGHISIPNVLLVFTMFLSLIYFFCQLVRTTSATAILNSAILTVFAVLYLIVCISYRTKNKRIIVISSFLLIGYFLLNIITIPESTKIRNGVIDFTTGSLKEAIVWANKNKIDLIQEYEYSDSVPEYEIIRQSVKMGTNLKEVKEIILSISEGPNPYKEIILPNMITWDSERVMKFISSNHLSNVVVDFVESDKVRNTVIEQSRSGSMQRNEEVKLTFSYGEEGILETVTMIDLTKKSKFEIEFFMKQNHLTYVIEEDFSDTIKKGYGIHQSVAAGEKVNTVDQRITVTISKGSKITIPNFHKMNVDEMTDWAIQYKLKLEFLDQYDDSVKEGNIITVDKEIGEVVEQGAHIKVTLSRGQLTMPKFKSADEFYAWADKYGIVYEVKHEFSDSVPAGEVIEYSHKKGDVIKNGESLSITISDGAKKVVPNVVGLTKNQAANKLKDAGFNYNFVYRNSTTTKDRVLAQSIKSGSEVSSGTTITVTLSNGQSTSNNTPSPSPEPSPSPSPDPEPPAPVCENVTVYIYDELLNIGNASSTCSKIKARYPTLNFTCNYVHDEGLNTGILSNSNSVDEHTFSTCDTITLIIVNNE